MIPRLARRAFLLPTLFGAVLAARAAVAAGPDAVPTFHSLGLSWSPAGGSASISCSVQYRPKGSSTWFSGLPLWFDSRNGEYRGSLVHLEPGTEYEITLALDAAATNASLGAQTWSESFPIAKTVTLPAGTTSSPFLMSESGSPGGWVLYEPAIPGGSTIQVDDETNAVVTVDASYVILRGATLRGGRVGVEMAAGAHHVVVEGCDISGWGRASSGSTTFGADLDSAVACRKQPGAKAIVVQRNRLHHPRYDTNAWDEVNPSSCSSTPCHPEGPQAISFVQCGGNYVIRYNDVYSDADHYYNDCIGGGWNFDWVGFPVGDSDIYANHISSCWDDGIEAEGGDRNIRIWGNHIEQSFVMFGLTPVATGPAYVWRNVLGASRESPLDPDQRGAVVKYGGKNEFCCGKLYFFHNTVLQPPSPQGGTPLGCSTGISTTWGGGEGYPMVSRNNILEVWKATSSSISDKPQSPANDFDFDLYNGNINAAAGAEAQGIHASPQYDPANAPGDHFLGAGTPGQDDGVKIPGLNDSFAGAGPDRGAYERGTQPLEFGVTAYLGDGGTLPPGDGGGTGGAGAVGGGGAGGAGVGGAGAGAGGAGVDAGGAGTSGNASRSSDSGGCGCELAGIAAPRSVRLSITMAALLVTLAFRGRGRSIRFRRMRDCNGSDSVEPITSNRSPAR